MKKNYFLESDANQGGFTNSLKKGCDFILRNKGKFIFGGLISAQTIGGLYTNWGSIKTTFDTIRAGGSAKLGSLWQGAGDGAGWWEQIKAYFTSIFRMEVGVAGEGMRKIDKGIDAVKNFFTKEGSIFGANNSLIGTSAAH